MVVVVVVVMVVVMSSLTLVAAMPQSAVMSSSTLPVTTAILTPNGAWVTRVNRATLATRVTQLE